VSRPQSAGMYRPAGKQSYPSRSRSRPHRSDLKDAVARGDRLRLAFDRSKRGFEQARADLIVVNIHLALVQAIRALPASGAPKAIAASFREADFALSHEGRTKMHADVEDLAGMVDVFFRRVVDAFDLHDAAFGSRRRPVVLSPEENQPWVAVRKGAVRPSRRPP
jgi:hypothetical protein